MASVSFEGGEELGVIAAQLRAKAATIGRRADEVLRTAARLTETTAKRLVPVDTGELWASIRHDVSGSAAGGGAEAVISANTSYAIFVEAGTSRARPQPYMGPALDSEGPRFVASIESIADPL